MGTENKEKIRSTLKDIRYFVLGIVILYLIGCLILSLTLAFFKEWGLVERGANGIYFTLDNGSIELIDFYNVFNAPRVAFINLFIAYPVPIALLNLLLFVFFIRLTSYPEKDKKGEPQVNNNEKQERVDIKPAFVDFVILGLKGNTKEEVLSQIAKFAKDKGLVKSQQYLYDRLMEKERMGSTAIGNGIALPEACFIDISQRHVFILCRTESAVDFGSFDGKPVSVMLVFLCREKNELAKFEPVLKLVQLLKSDKYKDKFKEASTEYEIYCLLEEISLHKDTK
ncbi:MAG: PTS sugar transporter subunit IIA [Candidatus Omnitrophica bacterium]|nr:PTS sugar transporter subunit IIA [Candidatus Omnitrophota bacterium]